MSEQKPEAKTEAPAEPETTEITQATELADKALDPMSGGLWPYVTSNNAYNKPI